MRQELTTLEQNQTWEVVPLPQDKIPIGYNWVYKTKLREDGSVVRHKARLVAKGYTQVEGVDYTKQFSPVAKSVIVHLFLALATAFQWPLHQIDINNAFLHGHLDEEIYMIAPEDYTVAPGHACLLRCSFLEDFGFQQSGHDHCLFFKSLKSGFVGLLVYIDDVLIMAPLLDLISQVKKHLDALFTIKDLGCAHYFLGLHIARFEAGTSLTQSKYILDIISDCGLQLAKPVATPLPPRVKLHLPQVDFLMILSAIVVWLDVCCICVSHAQISLLACSSSFNSYNVHVDPIGKQLCISIFEGMFWSWSLLPFFKFPSALGFLRC
ncbi:UNVERIFIED_CONTAM: putative mitochondrial protein [Sesamum indicum]